MVNEFTFKKVIFINDNYPISKMTEDVYPKEYSFTIAKNKSEFIKILEIFLEGDKEINQKYKVLQEKLSGSVDISKQNIIPETIENFLI